MDVWLLDMTASTAPPEQKPTTTTNKKQPQPAKNSKKKSEPQFRTCLTQTCAILGSDFMLHFWKECASVREAKGVDRLRVGAFVGQA